MADTNETIADIIAEKRQYADDLERACNEIVAEAPSLVEKMEDYKHTTIADIRREADRLEAAIKRERAKIEADALEVGGIVEAAHRSERGNAAKLREALVQVQKKIKYLIGNLTVPNSLVASRMEINGIINAALSAPPRNCDKYANRNDAMQAFEAFVREQGKLGFINPYTEAFKWLLAPATEKEGGAK